MHQIRRINHVGLRVRGLERAREFYEKIGFKFVVGPIGSESVAVMAHPSGININLIVNAAADALPANVLMDLEVKHAGYTHMALEVDDLKTVERLVRAAGIGVTETLKLPSCAECFFVRDPDNNVLEFHQPA